VDLAVFGLPLAASACQVVNIMKNDDKGHKSTLSFSVLFIFLHIVSEKDHLDVLVSFAPI
jgi:hypothetical protein